jgi:AcrR family transcriptional regulator
MTGVGVAPNPNGPPWRERAVSRRLNDARARAEQRAQRFLDAAFELIDEKGSTEFTIQEVVARSKQSLHCFYQFFESKDELVLALFEESIREAAEDIHNAVDAHTDPLERLHVYAIRLYEWCDPGEIAHKRGSHHRRAISDYSMQLAANHSQRIRAAIAPLWHLLFRLLDAAAEAGAIGVADTRRAATLLHQTVMNTSYGNRLVNDPKQRLSAEETWESCLHGLTTSA